MLRKVIGVLASALLVGSLAGGSALANHDDTKPPGEPHQGPPDNVAEFVPPPEGECSVEGVVHVDDQNGTGGVSADEVNHNHYAFVDSQIDCTSTVNDLNGTFTVRADGGTDGPTVPTLGHGESDATGWSHQSGYDDGSILERDSTAAASCDDKKDKANKGDIWVEHQQKGKQASGWVKFIREGTEVEAYGCLSPHNTSKRDIIFQAQLVFEPTDEPGTKVKNAILRGTATVGRQLEL